MKQYKHKNPIWTAKQVFNDEGKALYIARDNEGTIFTLFDEDKLLALGFEEVVEDEQKNNWIHSARAMYCVEKGQYDGFERAIEKHMPKQKKFTGNDVHEHSMKTYGSDSGFYVNFTLNFLRDHDLLEE